MFLTASNQEQHKQEQMKQDQILAQKKNPISKDTENTPAYRPLMLYLPPSQYMISLIWAYWAAELSHCSL